MNNFARLRTSAVDPQKLGGGVPATQPGQRWSGVPQKPMRIAQGVPAIGGKGFNDFSFGKIPQLQALPGNLGGGKGGGVPGGFGGAGRFSPRARFMR